MIQDSFSVPRFEDVKKTKLLDLTVFGAVLVVIASIMLFRMAPWKPQEHLMGAFYATMAGFFLFSIYIGMLGGPKKIWNEWHRRNYIGVDYVLWQAEPNELRFEFASTTMRAMVWPNGAGWRLYFPLGGWNKAPLLWHPAQSHSFVITKVGWDGMGHPTSVVLKDWGGNCLSMHPAKLLDFLEDPAIGRIHSFSLLTDLVQNVRQAFEEQRCNLEMYKVDVDQLRKTLLNVKARIGLALEGYQQSRRLQHNVKEAKPIFEHIEWLEGYLKSRPHLTDHRQSQ
jgi:hypothetical protein